jgi:hypothetical protein
VLASASVACASPFKPKELAQLLHAFGVAGTAPAGWAQHAWGACADVLPHFQPHELAIVLWSLARLRHSPGDEALQRAAEQLAARADDCDMQALSNAAWALAVLSKQPQPAAPLASLVRRAQALLPQSASPQALSNLLWALAKLGHDPGAAFVTACVARALALDAGLRCVRGGRHVRVVCACARACVFAACCCCCCLRCASASRLKGAPRPTNRPADLAQLCFGLVSLNYAAGPRTLDALAAALDAQLPACSAAQLATITQSLDRMGFDPPAALAQRLAQRAASLKGRDVAAA